MYSVARSAFFRNVGRGLSGQGVHSPLRDGQVFQLVWWQIKETDLPCARWRAHIDSTSKRGQGTFAASSTSSKSSSASSSGTPTPPRSPETTPPPKRRRIRRIFVFLSISAFFFATGFAMAAQPSTIRTGVSAAQAILNPPTDEETLTLFEPSTEEVAAIERQIFEHPLTQKLLQDDKFIASRPHLKIPETLRGQNLTGGTLLGPEKIAVPPLQFTTADGSEFVSLQYLGHALCGHPGIVHGGLLATLLDEGTARCCFPALPNKVAVTASLKVDYKRPCMAGQIVVLKAETTKVEGRKAWVKGRLQTLVDESKGETPVVLTEAEALFIEPKGAEKMKRVVVT